MSIDEETIKEFQEKLDIFLIWQALSSDKHNKPATYHGLPIVYSPAGKIQRIGDFTIGYWKGFPERIESTPVGVEKGKCIRIGESPVSYDENGNLIRIGYTPVSSKSNIASLTD